MAQEASARATLIPFPPATVRLSTARCRFPWRKFGTAMVRSIAALRVTVRITLAPLASALLPLHPSRPSLADTATRGRSNQYHGRARAINAITARPRSLSNAPASGTTARPQRAPAPPASIHEEWRGRARRRADRPVDLARGPERAQPFAAANTGGDGVGGPQRQLSARVADRGVGKGLAGAHRKPPPVAGEAEVEQPQGCRCSGLPRSARRARPRSAPPPCAGPSRPGRSRRRTCGRS